MGKLTCRRSSDDDPLRSLPDSLLISILSLLPTKDAISTSVLSHRWQHLWTHLTHLSFTGPHLPLDSTEDQTIEFLPKFHTFLTSVSHVLHRLTSPKLTKFHLITALPKNCDTLTPLYDSLVETCVRLVCSRHPEDISVTNYSLYPYFCSPLIKIPYTILQCQSINSLTLGDGLYCESPPNQFEISLPNLKKLRMRINDSHEKYFKTLFKSCPSLEELCLKTNFTRRTRLVEIFALELKRLTVDGDFTEYVDFVIDAPKLESLNLSGYSAFYRFVQKPTRLVNAKIDMWTDDVRIGDGDGEFADVLLGVVSVLLQGISCVRFLELNCDLLEFLGGVRDETLPVLRNLTQLTIKDFCCMNWRELLSFARYCPNFEFLVLRMEPSSQKCFLEDKIDWAALVSEPACLFTKLRVLELNNIWVKDGVFKFLEYILWVGRVLEKLHVSLCGDGDAQLRTVSEFCDKLFSYPRSSSLCEIKICGQYITASSKGFKDGQYIAEMCRKRQLQHVVPNDIVYLHQSNTAAT